MKKIIASLTYIIFYFLFSTSSVFASSDYIVTNFQSQIEVQRDASLLVTEKITANFLIYKHGIIRVVPVTYSASGRTIAAKFNLISVTDENDVPYKYSTSRLAQSVQIKIGDPEKTIIGEKKYFIKYSIKKVLLRYETHDEIYWNATGHEWDTDIEKTSATVISPYAEILKIKCSAGEFGLTQEENCESDFSRNEAKFESKVVLSQNQDMTVTLSLDNKNQLVFPSELEKIIDLALDNWGYLIAIFPFSMMFYFWFKKGRDMRFESDNVYTKQESVSRTVGLFEREHLPLAYSPIKDLTPSQLGTILDERVDLADVTAEIIELARLKYLKIEKIEKKSILWTSNDYQFTKLVKTDNNLKDFQKYLLDKIFSKGDTIKLSSLKNSFYTYLEEFKKKLYKNVSDDEKYFDGNPQTKKTLWFMLLIFSGIGSFIVLTIFVGLTVNSGPYAIFFPLSFAALFFPFSMSRRTAWGHSLFRQAKGMQFYIGEGKWRLEIAEKRLFIEEILPLAIALGVVDKLTRDMKALQIAPPSYLSGMTTAHLYQDLNSFQTAAASNLSSSPSGKSSWSGGSGFSSGGHSGGGFGGGGGSSW